MLGLYVSDHPLNGLEHVLASASDITIGQLIVDESREEGAVVTVAGLITSVVRKTTKKGDLYAVITVEDLEGAINVMVFPRDYQLSSTLLVEDSVVLVKGKVKRSRDEALELTCLEITDPRPDHAVPPTVRSSSRCPRCGSRRRSSTSSRRCCRLIPGVAEVHLKLQSAGRTMVMRLDERLRVTPSPALMADLKALLGPACLSA